jgi:hypothetical protein
VCLNRRSLRKAGVATHMTATSFMHVTSCVAAIRSDAALAWRTSLLRQINAKGALCGACCKEWM